MRVIDDTKLDADTLYWAALRIQKRAELCRGLGYNAAALAAFDEAWVIISAAASRVASGQHPNPRSSVQEREKK